MKKWAKILAFMGVMVFGLSAGLAGCATTTSIKNTEAEIIYNGNVAVNVGGYVYFGNSFIDLDEITDSSSYKSYAAQSYLARVDTNAVTQTSKDYSPSDVDTVSSEVTAYENSFMFVLGDYIYYATPYTQQRKDSDGELSYYYSYTTIYRSKLNGDGKKAIYSTDAEITQIEALKDPDTGVYYIVIYADTKLGSLNLSTLAWNELATDVTSVAMPETYNSSNKSSSLDFNGLIYYTATSDDNTVIKAVSLSGENEKTFKFGVTDISFIDRVQDVVFYTETIGSTTHAFMLDVSNGTFSTSSASGSLYTVSSSTPSDFYLVYNETRKVSLGYLYNYGSNLNYVSADGEISGVITIEIDGSTVSDYNIIAVSGRNLYFATTTGIYYVEFKDDLFSKESSSEEPIEVNNEKSDYANALITVVTMTDIYDGDYFAFDGTYIYYYATLEDLSTDEDEDEDTDDEEESEEEEETDENYYLYRVKISDNSKYSLLGYTAIESRHTV